MIGCDCNAGLSNTGRPGCVPLFSIISSLIVVPLYDSAGNRNGLDLNAAIPTDWSTFINDADPSKRWFPLPAFENVETPKADSQFEEAASGRAAFLREGKRSFSGELWAEDSTPTFLGKLKKSRCVDFGVYIPDVNGNLIGSEENGFLYPIPVENSSWNPTFMFATDSTVQKIMLTFEFDRLFKDETLYQITVDEAGQDFTKLAGLIDVNLLSLSASVTTATFTAKLDYGTAYNKIDYVGADAAADWAIFNNSTGLAVAIDTVTENPDGTYALAYSSGVSLTDNLTVSVSRDGYAGSASVEVA